MKNHLFQKSLFIAVIAIGVGVGISVWAQPGLNYSHINNLDKHRAAELINSIPECKSSCNLSLALNGKPVPPAQVKCEAAISQVNSFLEEIQSSPSPGADDAFAKATRIKNECCNNLKSQSKLSPCKQSYTRTNSSPAGYQANTTTGATQPAAQSTANSAVTAQQTQQPGKQVPKDKLFETERAQIQKERERIQKENHTQSNARRDELEGKGKLIGGSVGNRDDALKFKQSLKEYRKNGSPDSLDQNKTYTVTDGNNKYGSAALAGADKQDIRRLEREMGREARRHGRQDKREARENRKDLKDQARKDKALDGAEELMTDKDHANYGGKYKTTSFDTTDTINMAVDTVRGTTNGIMTGVQQGQAMQQQAQMGQSGMNFSNKDAVEMQKNALKQAAKGANAVGAVSLAMGAAQMFQMSKHKKSAKGMDKTKSLADQELARLEEKYNAECGNGSMPADYCEKKREEYDSYRVNINKNHVGEKQAQNKKALQQGITAMATIGDGSMNLMRAAMYKKQANNLMPIDGGNGGNFNGNFNPRGNDNDSPDQISTPEALTDNSIEQNKDEEKLELGDDSNFNPDMFNNDVAGGPGANPFQDKPLDAGGGAGGVGGGGAGGTSAAQDAATADNGPKGKSAGGGNYGKDEGSRSRFGRMGGGSGGSASPDMNFADLLKQFLPKDEKAEELAAEEHAEDRSPANDSASVMSREKNIFKEISKRYGKKHAEGAVLFQ